MKHGKGAGVEELRRLATEAVREAADDLVPWVTGMAECDACGYRWMAVRPLGAERLECPACGAMDGEDADGR